MHTKINTKQCTGWLFDDPLIISQLWGETGIPRKSAHLKEENTGEARELPPLPRHHGRRPNFLELPSSTASGVPHITPLSIFVEWSWWLCIDGVGQAGIKSWANALLLA